MHRGRLDDLSGGGNLHLEHSAIALHVADQSVKLREFLLQHSVLHLGRLLPLQSFDCTHSARDQLLFVFEQGHLVSRPEGLGQQPRPDRHLEFSEGQAATRPDTLWQEGVFERPSEHAVPASLCFAARTSRDCPLTLDADGALRHDENLPFISNRF